MRGIVRFLVLLLIVLAVAYLGAWWYVQGRMAVAFRAQEQALRRSGWTVSHGAITRGSSPLAATVAVTDLALTPPDQGLPTPTITLPGVTLTVRPVTPFTLDVDLPLAWHVAMPQGPSFTIQFASIQDHYAFDPNALLHHARDPLRSGILRVTGLRIDSADTNFTLISVDRFSAGFTRNPEAGPSATALTMHEALSGLALSPIFVSLGHLPFQGKLASLRLDADLSGPPLPSVAQSMLVPHPDGLAGNQAAGLQAWRKLGPMIHTWAQAGGHGRFTIALGLGPLNAHDHGHFGFDKTDQPEGKAVLVADGIGAFLGDIANAYPATIDLISTLTTETAPYMSKTPGGTQRLTIDFALAGGVLTADGKKAALVPKIVWPAAATP
ncbi:DUF2125 domain-containing protein [Acidiphilium sp.]|uniref:DUF2125 domain-containing protein n=1 Tax=Acidiphilium sp. TaxID=527 RepID=UPI003D057FCF